jgi:hypothetical protein
VSPDGGSNFGEESLFRREIFILLLYDASGRQVESESGEATIEPILIEVSHLPSGAYSYDISFNNRAFSGQIIKK